MKPFFGNQLRQRSHAASVRAPKIPQVLAHQLRKNIARGDLKAGDVLPNEEQLRAAFGVSRTAIREAVRILEAEGLLEVIRGARGGVLVKPADFRLVARATDIVLRTSRTSIADMYEMRVLIEPAAARLAAERNRLAAADELRALLRAHREHEEDKPAALNAVMEFHRLLFLFSGSQTLRAISSALNEVIERHRESLPDGSRAGLEEMEVDSPDPHVRLVDLIEEGNQIKAEAHWRAHMAEMLAKWTSQPGSAMRFGLPSD